MENDSSAAAGSPTLKRPSVGTIGNQTVPNYEKKRKQRDTTKQERMALSQRTELQKHQWEWREGWRNHCFFTL